MASIFKWRNIYPPIGVILSLMILYFYGIRGTTAQVGALLLIIGLLIYWTAHLTLGDSFALLPKAKQLVAKGIYTKLKHPIYVGVSLATVGLAMISKSPLLLAVAIITIGSSIWRAVAEEKVLLEKFGEDYREYKRKTWF